MVLQWHRFGFPWLVTATHNFSCIIGMRLLAYSGWYTPKVLDKRQKQLLWIFSVLYTINIAVSNVSLHYVTVPLHQVVRGTVPVFTVLISLMSADPPRYSAKVYMSLFPVVLGVGLATYGDHYSFSMFGFLLTLLGTILAATKTVVTNSILVGKYKLKLPALDLLYQLSPMAFVQTCTWALVTGEIFSAKEFLRDYESNNPGYSLQSLLIALAVNGAIAFVLNIASFTASKNTSALAMTITGNVKVVLTVVLGCILFHVSLSGISKFGVVLTLAGGAAYSAIRLAESKARAQARSVSV
ncbi:hypothetical protein GGI25_006236 [Coemansia spiralis]|uniref:Sugar phosphate transporter domain-containing protein n=2 Tax=Coemansia TaxID=4863 RepID=A0A9W8FX90_9FUNG|nr:triose-phosphate transporter family-domain-containing protein [Coemansia spiralis]KAJ1986749.1 hypothetical protein EDC05_006173 [Coemansia umbellata]KAJ2618830.1 hypothetical protein GGI26_006315 [Coemansia sp. RSA 1358]KAJ2669179.1 hypothetical protein GGI25_006236 [Coemansia spiralis]